jgi:hypothetical protein
VHEFEIVLEEGGPDTVVNTACGAADVPEDSQVPPTINCDPAGLEVDGEPTHTKELVSATPIGNGQWEVVYGIDVSNASTAPTSYSLADTLHFTDEADIVSAEVTSSPDGVLLADPAWDGQSENLIASGVPLAGKGDDDYAVHRYEVTVIADVPLHIPGAGGADGPAGCGPEGDDSDTAFNNTSAMTNGQGETEEDQACAPIPSIGITKSVVGEPVAGKDGKWTVTYEITAVNDGAAKGAYTLTDRLRFGAGIEVTAAEVTDTPKGVTAARSWTGRGREGATENVVATDVNLRAGATHTYRVRVEATVPGAGDGSGFTCPEPGSGKPGGFANTAGIGHNGLAGSADACATPDNTGTPDNAGAPDDPGTPGNPGHPGASNNPPPLAVTGADIGWIAGVGALLVLLGALAIVIARRHRRDVS